MTRAAIEASGCADVCLAGGVALNCKMNMEIAAEPSVAQALRSAGTARRRRRARCGDAEMRGSGSQDRAADACLLGTGIFQRRDQGQRSKRSAPGTKWLTILLTRCVTDLVEQKTVGWFQGRMEYGPRALGNRSIIADPRSAGMKDRINVSIKYREEFRPFCPSVLFERQAEYFEDTFDAPFMVVTFPVNESVKQKIPAVVHVDDTARIQSVHRGDQSALQPPDRRVRQSELGADADQHQPQHQRAADGEFAAGGAAHLFLLGPGRAFPRSLPIVEIELTLKAADGTGSPPSRVRRLTFIA